MAELQNFTEAKRPRQFCRADVVKLERLLEGGESYERYASWYASGYPNELEHYSLKAANWNATWKWQRRRQYVCALVIRTAEDFENCSGTQVLRSWQLPFMERFDRLILGRLWSWAQGSSLPLAQQIKHLAAANHLQELLRLFKGLVEWSLQSASLRDVVAGFLNGNGATYQEDTREIRKARHLLPWVELVCAPKVSVNVKKRYLEELSYALRPQELKPQAREMFVRQGMSRGVVTEAVRLIETAPSAVAAAATNFLGDFAFNSDMGSREVLKVFDRIADRFQLLFASSSDKVSLMISEDWLLQAAILLCVNIAATCPAGHMKLVRLAWGPERDGDGGRKDVCVQPVCLKILQSPQVGDKLRGNTILLLANLSMTVLNQLRELQVAKVLLQLVENRSISEQGKSVAESVIIFLHGEEQCPQVDLLMERSVVSNYCIPIMAHTLKGTEFRGMFPHLLYSAKLFQVLSRCRVYAEKLLKEQDRVVPLLLRAVNPNGPPPRVETDYEGRRLVLEALWSLAKFKLWPAEKDEESRRFIEKGLAQLKEDRQVGIRAAAAGIDAQLHSELVLEMLTVGKRLEADGWLPPSFWNAPRTSSDTAVARTPRGGGFRAPAVLALALPRFDGADVSDELDHPGLSDPHWGVPKGIILSARREEALLRVKSACCQLAAELAVKVLPLDLAELKTLPQKASEAKKLFGEVDVLINNGGVGFRGLGPLDRWLNVDYFSGVILTKSLLPDWLQRHRGHVVQVSSVQGFFGLPGRTAYAAAKHAAVGFYDALRAEVSERGVEVTTICPGYIATGHSQNAVKGEGAKYLGKVCEVVEATVGWEEALAMLKERQLFAPSQQRPVVLRGLARHLLCPAAGAAWSFEQLGARAGDVLVEGVRRGAGPEQQTFHYADESKDTCFSDASAHHQLCSPMSLAEFLRRSGDGSLYLWAVLRTEGSLGTRLRADLDAMRWETIRQLSEELGTLKKLQLFCGAKGIVTACHYEPRPCHPASPPKNAKTRVRFILFPPLLGASSLQPFPVTHPRDRCARLDLDREDRRGECSAAFGQGARGRRVDRRRRDANCEGLDEWIRHVGTDGFLQYLEEAGLPADLLFNLGCGETSMMVLCWSRFGVSFASTSQRHRSNRGGRRCAFLASDPGLKLLKNAVIWADREAPDFSQQRV
eukprot:g30875.t1